MQQKQIYVEIFFKFKVPFGVKTFQLFNYKLCNLFF